MGNCSCSFFGYVKKTKSRLTQAMWNILKDSKPMEIKLEQVGKTKNQEFSLDTVNDVTGYLIVLEFHFVFVKCQNHFPFCLSTFFIVFFHTNWVEKIFYKYYTADITASQTGILSFQIFLGFVRLLIEVLIDSHSFSLLRRKTFSLRHMVSDQKGFVCNHNGTRTVFDRKERNILFRLTLRYRVTTSF